MSDSSSCAPQASNPKPESIPAAAPASSKTVKVIGQTKKPEATGRATTTVTPTLPCSVRTSATAAQAAHISEVTSSTPFDIDVGLASDSCADQACNFKPASFPATPNANDMNTPAGAVESVGRCSRVVERQKKLADAMFERQKRLADAINPSNTTATSILPPSYARVPKQPAAGYVDDVPRQDAQALPLSGDTPPPPKMDTQVPESGLGAAKVSPTILPPVSQVGHKIPLAIVRKTYSTLRLRSADGWS